MQKLISVLAASVLLASAANADTEIHSIDYSYSLEKDEWVLPRLTLPGFDDEGGTRTLTRVDVRLQTQVSASLAIENMTDVPLNDWSLDGQHTLLVGFERENPEEYGPFAFMGGLFLGPVTAPLAATDGVAGAGSDFLEISDSVAVDSQLEMEAGYLSFFSGGGEVVAVVGPFTESFLEGAERYDQKLGIGDATVDFTDLAQEGSFSVIYTYSVVPEPASLLALAGLVLTRRRR